VTDPAASSPAALARMLAQRRRDTAPEVALRRALHRRGLRFRVHRRPVPSVRREADVVFASQRVAVFVDGCWWHGCPEHHTPPMANHEWWAAKISATRARDGDTERRLAAAGWTVVRVWEHEAAEAAAEVVECAVVAAPMLREATSLRSANER
jgi:DNA mismatch endonuclease (patch repair protein)